MHGRFRPVRREEKNIMEKAASAPFRFFANTFGGKEEDYRVFGIDYLQTCLNISQEKTLDNLARVLSEKPELKLQLVQSTNRQDESEAYALLQVKKQFLNIDSDSMTMQSQKRVDSLSDKDSLLNTFVNRKLQTDTSFISIGEKCVLLAGKEKLDAMVIKIMEKRNQSVLDYLIRQKRVSPERLTIISAKDELSRGQSPKYVINIGMGEEMQVAATRKN